MKRPIFVPPCFKSKFFYVLILVHTLCQVSLVQGQTPFILKCSGEGENNLANFTIQNTLPEKGIECPISDKCNPYFISTLDAKGDCLRHTWLINNVEQSLENPIAFCNAFELGKEQEITHIVSIFEEKDWYEYKATCTFTPATCCDLSLDIKLRDLRVIEENKEGKFCYVAVEENIGSVALASYTVETLNGIVYEGDTPQKEYKVPCGNVGDMLCFTAKTKEADCEKEMCIFLDKLESDIKPRIAANSQKEIGLACYPNPAKDILTVNANIADETTAQLTIRSLYGAKVYTQQLSVGQNQREIDISTFEPGNYLVTIMNDKGAFAYKKIVIIN